MGERRIGAGLAWSRNRCIFRLKKPRKISRVGGGRERGRLTLGRRHVIPSLRIHLTQPRKEILISPTGTRHRARRTTDAGT